MKQIYNKPMARVEFFALSQTIANDCGTPPESSLGYPSHDREKGCGWTVGNKTFWLSTDADCDTHMAEDGYIDGVCYHNPINGVTIFNS